MKKNIFKIGVVAAALTLGMTSCEDFLNAPTIDSYSAGTFYKDDAQLEQGVNYLYNSPWFDVIRPYIGVGEIMSGNYYWGTDMGTSGYGPYLYWSLDGTLQTLKDMSYSLWSVNAHCNTVITNILSSNGPSVEKKKQCIGEALTWKAFAYFMLARAYGEVPIVHDNGQLLNEKDADGKPMFSQVKKADRASVYDYTILTLRKAMDLLPVNKNPKTDGRIDFYTAQALLAKVYLTKAGVSGSLNADDLKKASELADSVIVYSGRELMPVYSDIFRGQNNISEESLLAWRWKCPTVNWTQQNALQADMAMNGFDEWGPWGGWNGISTDLQEAFGITALDDPSDPSRPLKDKDQRRKATYMTAGDVYEYFWQDKGGFDLLRFLYGEGYRDGGPMGGPGVGCYGGGAFMVKHLHGNNADHIAAFGYAPDRNMSSSLATHLLRLSDVYLIYAEAEALQNGNQVTGKALERFNAVRHRAGADEKTSATWEDVWNERRLEFAGEGDRWYDFVRVAYYDEAFVAAKLNAQHRNTYWGLDELWKPYYESGVWNRAQLEADNKIGYDETPFPAFPGKVAFTLPMPTEDVATNPNMATSAPAEHVDVAATYSYDYIKF
ncbi:MAG: RagB/SusD family nutrient uptake outer membrane protein [Paludibacteraceae bacterium]|nr:RagB/SusD family nutrient uptake outer membrane protein [Paludibacteraceae bacterium]